LLSVMGAFAEFERTLISERQLEGIALAKKNGKFKGRKPMLDDEQFSELKEMIRIGEKKTVVAQHFKMSRETLYRYLNRGVEA
jgi:DNA invertase Pin-like site-specific DNA recombinase